MPAHPTREDSPLHQIDLDGLTLLLKESRAYPVVSLDVLVQVGAKDEPPGLAGAAHFIEHLLFRTHDGEVRTDPAERLQRVGGEMNGYTTHDFTCCTVTVASRFLDLALEVQSEIFLDPPFRPDDFETERGIVLQEIEHYEDSPLTEIQELGNARLFGDHPYARQVHGGSRSVARMRREELVGLFESSYCRERMIVVAVGDFEADQLTDRLASSLRALRSLCPPPPTFSEPPPVPEPGQLRIERDLQLTHLDFVFPAVPMSHPDFPSLMALSIILGGGRASRVFRELFERRRLVQSIGTTVPPLKLAGLFGISTTFEPEREDLVRQALKDEMARVRSGPVDEDELALARKKAEASAVFKNETVSGQSFTLGLLACLANPDYERQFLDALRALTPEALLESAQKYLNEDSLIELCCGPRCQPGESAQAAAQERALERPDRTTPLPDRGEYELVQDEEVRKIRLHNGAVVLIREDHDLPIVSIAAVLKAGSGLDPDGKSGLASLTQDLLHRGTRARTAEQIAYASESLGAELAGGCSLDISRLEAYGLSRDFPDLIKLFAEVLTEPAFDAQEFGSIRDHVLTELRGLEDDLDSHVSRMLSEAIFGPHPYARSPLGTEETVRELSVEDLRQFHARHYCGGNLVVAVVGNIAWQDAAHRVAGALQELSAGLAVAPATPQFPVLQQPKRLKLKRPFAVPSVNVGWRLPETVHPDHPALHVLSVVLGGPFSSRLWKELREKRGLCYALGAEIIRGEQASVFGVSAATSKRRLTQVRGLIFEHVADLRTNGCSAGEVDVARKYIIGAHELSHQGPSAWADLLASYEASGLGWQQDLRYPELISQVTPDELRRVARDYLPLDGHVLLTVKPEGIISRLVSRLLTAIRSHLRW